MDYQELAHVDFLPELERLDLDEKAEVIQALLERNFFHPSGLFYSILLITGPHALRPMTAADMEGTSDLDNIWVDADGHGIDGTETIEAAKNEGPTFENSITSAGLYLQAQAARYAVSRDPLAYKQAQAALNSLKLIYDYSKERGRAGWLGKPYGRVPKDHSAPDQYLYALLGLYRFHEVADAPERATIAGMVSDIAEFMSGRDYQIWNLREPVDAFPWNLREPYCNATYVLAQALAFRLTGEDRLRAEALRLAGLSFWRQKSQLEDWAEHNRLWVLEFERVCLGAFVLRAAGALYELLPELFGDTPEKARATLERMLAQWWIFARLGIDDDFYMHYWIDINTQRRTWQSTGIRPVEHPPFAALFFSYYSDVRMSDSIYRAVHGALTVIAHLPEQREAALAWVREAMRRTSGRRLRSFIDLDGRQLKPELRWIECYLSSESPFHYLTVYWRGRQRGYW